MFATPKFIIYSVIFTISSLSVGVHGQVNDISEEAAEFRELMWEDLMSPADLAAILNAPMLSHDSFGGRINLVETQPMMHTRMPCSRSTSILRY